jgi:hypothetical protein
VDKVSGKASPPNEDYERDHHGGDDDQLDDDVVAD